ncbi:unnamed protein product [Tuber melanosporum]|uniref:(Perigord truffle) hypothetical protein n=1 Tax=Tuber melanosporum (strain Mel28) TaxID=656061 RepID=D5G7J8_TUBMM|nr:uncharacterized protein GSTUM_00002606001 [Tuber melanosporum]CAZ80491.1 unnamed protein product [Tuber melanosporum]
MSKPNITRHFRGGMEELKTADGITLYAYKSVLGQGTSPYLNTPWECFTTSTVERFLEYCYQGDYSPPKPAKLPLATPTSSVVDADGNAIGVFQTAAGHLPCCQLANRRAAPQGDHHLCCSCIAIQEDDTEEDEGSKYDGVDGSDTEYADDKDDSGPSRHPHGLDYFEVFFTHAELYILSQTQGQSLLAALCLNRLRTALEKAAKAPVRPRFPTNLSRLLSYAYEHNNVRLIDDNQAHDLQNLASSCAAMHIKDMKEECSSLMGRGGKMAEDLMKEVADRAISLDSVLEMEMEKMETEKMEMKEKMKKMETEWMEVEKKLEEVETEKTEMEKMLEKVETEKAEMKKKLKKK